MSRKTNLSLEEKHYDPKQVEEQIYALWEDNSVFKAGQDKSKKPFSIVIPPPNVTGRLHMGHALNNTLQDAVIRYKRMDGFDALWIPGTDHAGIATQTVVKKQLDAKGIDYLTLGREKFVEQVWEWKAKYGDTILNQLRRMGCSCDWSRTAFTMSEELSLAVRVAFKKMYDAGHIYRGNFIVNWCPTDKTALSDSEVETKEGGEPGHLWYFQYPLVDGSGHITIATTRPETILGDVAVAVNPKDERYAALIGKKLKLPIVGREIPIIADDYVDAEFGSGCVKITPAHDKNDFQIGLRHKLEAINIMNEDATLNDQVPAAYQGLNRFVARKKIVAELESLGCLEKVEDRMTPIGRSYRSKDIIEYRLSDQWFMKMRPLAENALAQSKAGNLKFYPDRWDEYYQNWLENVYDWCISRQLWWGHQIPAWYHKETREILVDVETPEAVKKNPEQWEQDQDVLDTWFSSALWPYSTLGWPEQTEDLARFYPTSILITGKDIIALWVARMVMTGLVNAGDMPYREVLINSIVCDEDGETMSKSKGNGIDPLHIIYGASKEELTGPVYEARPSNMKELLKRIDTLFPDGFEGVGADAMRYTLLTTATDAQQQNVSLKKFAEIGRPLGDKLWNAAKLVLGLIAEGPEQGAQSASRLEDRWILGRLDKTISEVRTAFDTYKFHIATDSIYHFFWGDVCDWYLEIVKKRVREGSVEDRRQVAVILTEVLSGVLKLLHPIMPFITEEIWGHFLPLVESKQIPVSGSHAILALATFPQAGKRREADVEQQFSVVQEVVRSVRNLRLAANVSPKDALECKVKLKSQDYQQAVTSSKDLIVRLANLKSLDLVDSAPEKLAVSVIAGGEVYVNLAEYMDVAAEIDRNQKALEKQLKLIATLEGKLNNEGFVARAPAEVVQVEREKLAEAINKKDSIARALEELAQLK